MSHESKRTIRCAIYTRKSSEEGLEQSFNSLDAQREACAAYILSQRHEGWRPVNTHYDDGGYSGGTMERPALRRLLADIDAGRIDTVVVYKVDRLTRALADFAKIVETFDGKGISFVSVTQQFNTTTSMGRLTLNVLLSFAQFEREVTGERIRDKIAASKKKGMWMGGPVPLGYVLGDHKLLVDPAEATRVQELYGRYLELGYVAKLKAELDGKGVVSKVRVSKTGNQSGGRPYSRGALYCILKSRIYLGEVEHQGLTYPGEHDAIVPRETWDRVQGLLKEHRYARRNRAGSCELSLLAGLLVDGKGNRFAPTHTLKTGKRYRYYVSRPAALRRPGQTGGASISIPAHEIEDLVSRRVRSLLSASEDLTRAHPNANTQALVAAARQRSAAWAEDSPADTRQFLRSIVERIIVNDVNVEVQISKQALCEALLSTPAEGSAASDSRTHPRSASDDNVYRLMIEARLQRFGREVRIVVPSGCEESSPARPPVPALIKTIARAQSWYEKMLSGEIRNQRILAEITGLEECYVSRVVQCAFLAPDIVEAILDGRQPADLTLEKLLAGQPMDWAEQRRRLGFSRDQLKNASSH